MPHDRKSEVFSGGKAYEDAFGDSFCGGASQKTGRIIDPVIFAPDSKRKRSGGEAFCRSHSKSAGVSPVGRVDVTRAGDGLKGPNSFPAFFFDLGFDDNVLAF